MDGKTRCVTRDSGLSGVFGGLVEIDEVPLLDMLNNGGKKNIVLQSITEEEGALAATYKSNPLAQDRPVTPSDSEELIIEIAKEAGHFSKLSQSNDDPFKSTTKALFEIIDSPIFTGIFMVFLVFGLGQSILTQSIRPFLTFGFPYATFVIATNILQAIIYPEENQSPIAEATTQSSDFFFPILLMTLGILGITFYFFNRYQDKQRLAESIILSQMINRVNESNEELSSNNEEPETVTSLRNRHQQPEGDSEPVVISEESPEKEKVHDGKRKIILD